MTNTKVTIKCDSDCLHNIKDQKFGFSGVKTTKWHTCTVCGRWQVYNWIVRHETLCQMAKDSLEKKGGLN